MWTATRCAHISVLNPSQLLPRSLPLVLSILESASLYLVRPSFWNPHPCTLCGLHAALKSCGFALCACSGIEAFRVLQYVDYVGSWGPAIVGHAHPEVTEALTEQIKKVRKLLL